MRLSFLTLVALGVVPAVGFGQQENLLNVGSRSQLLLDPALVYESQNVAFTPHPAVKHPQNPVLKAEQPWEGWSATAFNSSVQYDPTEKRFTMWYTGSGNLDYFTGTKRGAGTYFASSRDGLTWEKPPVGTIQADRKSVV